MFSKGYLQDYPVFVRSIDEGLLVLGYPKDSFMKLTGNNVKANARILISRRMRANTKKERRYFDIYFPNAFTGYFLASSWPWPLICQHPAYRKKGCKS